MITPHFSPYRMAWPFTLGDFSTIDTDAADPAWFVEGHYTTPPPEVCDTLTAASFDFAFVFDSSAFNTLYTETFPTGVTFSKTLDSGTWFASIDGAEETWNTTSVWDTQVKLFEGFVDPDEDFTNIPAGEYCGVRFYETHDIIESGSTVGYYTIDVIIYAAKPKPALSLTDDPVWTVTGVVFPVITKVIFSGPSTTAYSLNPGYTYLDIDHLGGSGSGEGGSFSTLTVAIGSHF